ncbi:Signal transduction histidine kinase [Anaeromicropila populeti]|uniref:histidine kinase n=1 Tax=Anaeromicropila populeti TaxID=37658 RepID=A0A1I6K4Q7_9FIRM|nr:HAMP domain-containing sensor histidine kinase [Anaeromicropila populeti]SFR86209.1 Signal transduction histidine kinase [Anaeromicropila populeti]
MSTIFKKLKQRFVILQSMRLQLLVVCIFLGTLPMLVFSRLIISSYETQAMKQRVTELSQHGNMIANLLVSSNYIINAEQSDFTSVISEIEQVAEIYNGRILIVDSNLHVMKDTFGVEETKTLISEEAIKGLRGTESQYIDNKNHYIELTIPVMNSTTKEKLGAIIMSFSIKNIHEIYVNMNQKATTFLVVLGIVVIMFAAFYSAFLVKPLKQVTASIDRWTNGYMEEKVSIKGFLEMENISASFNHMLNRLQKLEDSRQEFVSNVSHELKTPITSIKVLADSLLSQEDVPGELYKEFLVDITEEIERENKIINDLLSLVKMDKKSGEMNISSVNINGLVEQILKRLQPIADKRNIELVFETFRPVIAEVDEVKISLAINNLIENAIKYNYEDGWVHVTLNADHKFFYLKVADSGVGIPEDAQDSIFERFYRVDKARSRETGGTGLGLSITRNAVLMHRGAIKVYSKEQEGTTFTVRIPLTYIA